MEAILDIARDFKVFIPSEPEVISFHVPDAVVFKKRGSMEVEVRVGEHEGRGDWQGDEYIFPLNHKHLSTFSPPEDMKDSFEKIFDYYLLHTVKYKAAEVDKISVVIPLSSSIALENLLLKINKGRGVYRDVEAYAAYYLSESPDLPELWHFAEEDTGTHIYGMVQSGGYPYLYLIDYRKGEPPGILDFSLVDTPGELFFIFKVMMFKYSSDKSRVFFFTELEVEGITDIFSGGNREKAVDVEIEKGKVIPLRMLRKKERSDNTLVKGIYRLEEKEKPAPVFRFSLFSQETQTGFAKLAPGKEFKAAVDFPRVTPKKFFANFFVGANPVHTILLERVFIDTGAIVEKHIELTGKVERLEDTLRVNLTHANKIKKEAVFPLRKEFRIT